MRIFIWAVLWFWRKVFEVGELRDIGWTWSCTIIVLQKCRWYLCYRGKALLLRIKFDHIVTNFRSPHTVFCRICQADLFKVLLVLARIPLMFANFLVFWTPSISRHMPYLHYRNLACYDKQDKTKRHLIKYSENSTWHIFINASGWKYAWKVTSSTINMEKYFIQVLYLVVICTTFSK